MTPRTLCIPELEVFTNHGLRSVGEEDEPCGRHGLGRVPSFLSLYLLVILLSSVSSVPRRFSLSPLRLLSTFPPFPACYLTLLRILFSSIPFPTSLPLLAARPITPTPPERDKRFSSSSDHQIYSHRLWVPCAVTEVISVRGVEVHRC